LPEASVDSFPPKVVNNLTAGVNNNLPVVIALPVPAIKAFSIPVVGELLDVIFPVDDVVNDFGVSIDGKTTHN